MFDKPIDFKKLHQELSNTYKRQMEIKKTYPNRYHGVVPSFVLARNGGDDTAWYKARAEFDSLSYDMTILCCILNHAKGKLHMSKLREDPQPPVIDYGFEGEVTLDIQKAIIGDAWKEFILEDEEEVKEEATPEPRKSVVARFASALGL